MIGVSDAPGEVSSALLDSAVEEVLRRDPRYFSRFALRASVSSELNRYRSTPRFEGVEAGELTGILERAIDHFTRRGVRFAPPANQPDPVAQVLFDSAIDAAAAASGGLSLRVSARVDRPWTEVLASDYDKRESPGGARYFLRRRGARPLLLINAVGLPLGIWSRLLADPTHDFRVIVVESRGSDLFRGGVRAHVDVAADARDIADVLERESIAAAAVLAWCNGGRVALELAATHPDRVQSLTLLSTTMMGFTGVDLRCSTFEKDLDEVFHAVRKRPQLAAFFTKTLGAAPEPDWDSVADDAVARAALLFRLPPREQADALRAPMVDGASFLNYARRGASDGEFAVNEALGRIGAPILLITGRDDEIVNNALTMAALVSSRRRFVHAEVSGAGHYINDLQYPYLLWALERWLDDLGAPPETARVRVAELGSG